MRTLISGVILAIAAVAGLSAVMIDDRSSTLRYDSDQRTATADDGKQLAASYCGTCHVQPTPDVLDRSTWVSKIFPRMRKYLGLDPVTTADVNQHDLLALFPTHPMMTEDEWFAIASYYIEGAPKALPIAPRPPIVPETSRWKADTATIRVDMPITSLCSFDPGRSLMLIGDGMSARVMITGVDAKPLTTVQLQGPASSAVPTPNGWLITDMGKLLPHDSAVGSLWEVTWQPATRTTMSRKILDTLRRPVHLSVADVDADGRNDYVICEYGNMIGRVGYYSILANGRVRYTSLVALPGAIKSMVRDINNDGKLDIIVLMAQAREGIYAFINKGKGRFDMQALLTFHPAFGSSNFDMVDVDGDKDLDIVATCGDNGDYEVPPYKPYHGTYIYRNDGKLRFVQQLFLPQNGAYGAAVRDFDGDGDMDIASISYFPDYTANAHEAFLYWERQADGTYIPHSIPQAGWGRWIVYDCADVDADGDLDFLMANVCMGPGNVTPALQERWINEGRSYMLLRNTTR